MQRETYLDTFILSDFFLKIPVRKRKIIRLLNVRFVVTGKKEDYNTEKDDTSYGNGFHNNNLHVINGYRKIVLSRIRVATACTVGTLTAFPKRL